MRNRIVWVSVFALAISAIAPLASAQDLPSGEEVINKYLEASGEKDALKDIKNRITKGSFSLPDMGMSGATVTYVEDGNMLNVITLDGFGEVKRGVTGDVVWSINPMEGATILEGAMAEDQKSQASLATYGNWKDRFTSAETVGEEDVDGTAAYAVKMTPKEGSASTVYFAKDSGLALQAKGTGPDGMETTTIFSEYKEVDGVQVPHKIRIEGGMMTFEITTDSVEHNAEIPAGTFDLPEEIKALQGGGAAEAAAEAPAEASN